MELLRLTCASTLRSTSALSLHIYTLILRLACAQLSHHPLHALSAAVPSAAGAQDTRGAAVVVGVGGEGEATAQRRGGAGGRLSRRSLLRRQAERQLALLWPDRGGDIELDAVSRCCEGEELGYLRVYR